MYQDLPLSERDRRWGAIRVAMREAGLDGLVVPLGNGVDSRYVTLVRGAMVAHAVNSEAPIVVMDQGQSNAWIPEPLATVRSWVDPSIGAMRAAGLTTGVVGIAGLRAGEWTHVDAGDGSAVHAPLVGLIAAFPRVRFVDATDVLGRVRARKSLVEIELLSEAAKIARSGIDALRRRIDDGVTGEELLAVAVSRMLELGSEYRPSRVRILNADSVMQEACAAGTVIHAEVTGCVSGNTVTEHESFVVGSVPSGWEAQEDLFAVIRSSLLDDLRVGVTAHRLFGTVEEIAAAHEAAVSLEIHGAGLGGDGPVVTSQWRSRGAMSQRFEDGACLSMTIEIRLPRVPLPYRSSFATALVEGRPRAISPSLDVDALV